GDNGVAVHQQWLVSRQCAAPILPLLSPPKLPQRVEMSRSRAELRIRQRHFAAPGFVREVLQRLWCGGKREFVRVDCHAPAAIAERSPTIRLSKKILRRQLPRAH